MSKKLESLKVDIGSLLLTNQKPITVEEFRKQFKQVTGQYVPYRDLGFRNELELLQQMPDVVCIRNSRGVPVLSGYADEKTQHIKDLVSRQKPSKGKPVSHSRQFNYNYPLPPRFTEKPRRPPPGALPADVRVEINNVVVAYRDGITMWNLYLAYKKKYGKELNFQKFGFATLYDLIRASPELKIITRNNEDVIFHVNAEREKEARQKQSSMQNNSSFNSNSSSLLPTPPSFASKKTAGVTQYHSASNASGPAMNPIPVSKKLDRLGDFPELPSQPECKSISPNLTKREQLHQESLEDTSGISDVMKKDFLKVIEKYPGGIQAQDFPDKYEEVTGLRFDLHNLGYYKLSELIDKLPAIFQRKSVPGIKNNWRIYPASSDCSPVHTHNDDSLKIQNIISNISNILLACPEGIRVKEFMGIYNANSIECLDLEVLGFDNVIFFLKTIADDVPFVFSGSTSNDTAMIHHYKYRKTPTVSTDRAQIPSRYEVPSDIVSPDCPFNVQSLPDDLSKCIPVFIATVVHPNYLFMQLKGKDTDGQLILLSEDLDTFYHSPEANAYQMKDRDVMIGATCAAIWPHDNHWYRVEIKSIPSLDTVEAFYVDYGNQVRIPRSVLRYLKQEFMPLPAQAINMTLAKIRPSRGAAHWDPLARDYILSRWQDAPLLAYVTENTFPYHILLFDTCDKQEVCINKELVDQGIAENEALRSEASFNQGYQPSRFSTPSPTTHAFNRQSPILQAAVDNCMQAVSKGEAYMKVILKTVLENNPILRGLPEDQLLECVVKYILNPSAPNPHLNPNGMSNLPQSVYNFPASQPGCSGFQANHHSAFLPYSSTQPRSHNNIPSGMNSGACAAAVNGAGQSSDEEVFIDEDDEIFEAFCDEDNQFVLKKLVRRVRFCGGYKIHIIVVDNNPYVSCGDVSALLWEDKVPLYLAKMLEFKGIVIPTIEIKEGDYEEIFTEMNKYRVKGIQEVNSEAFVSLYPLTNVIDILNIFGHPSRSIREEINIYVKNFNPEDICEDDDAETEDIEKSETDQDKIYRLCAYELTAMVQVLHYKKLSIINDLKEGKNYSGVDKIERIDNLSYLFNKRIKEIEDLGSTWTLSNFADLNVA